MFKFWRIAFLLFPVVAFGTESLTVTLGDSTVAIRSLLIKKKLYLHADDLSKLPLTVRGDTASGLFVICSMEDCLPIFMLDPEEYRNQSGQSFLRAERVADALHCQWDVKKDRALLKCSRDLSQDHAVASDVGNYAPGFSLNSRYDSTLALTSLRQSGPVVVAFIRSGEWDPFSRLLLLRLQSVYDSLRSADINVVAIHGYESKFSGIWQDSLKLAFPLLADDGSVVMRGYEVFDRGTLPHPALFLVDTHGIIRFRHVYENLDTPPDIADLMNAITKARN